MDTSAFLIALAVVYLVPGPDMLLLFQTGARQGRRAALVTALGLALARACHVLMAATGLALLFRTAPWTFDLVRLLGAAYLAWLGLQMLRGGGLALPTSDAGSAPVVPHADRRALLRGLLTNLLNPKALLFCSVLLPQFVSPGPVRWPSSSPRSVRSWFWLAWPSTAPMRWPVAAWAAGWRPGRGHSACSSGASVGC